MVVQELVPADASGVLFTANPLTGARDQVMINAGWGLGEAIVGGLVTPDTVVVDKASGAIADAADRRKDGDDRAARRTARARRRCRPISAHVAVLSRAQAAELARLGTRIEQLYGRPMDIEWAHPRRPHLRRAGPPDHRAAEPAGSTPLPNGTCPAPKGTTCARASSTPADPLSPLFATLGLPAGTSHGQLTHTLGMGDVLQT